MKLLSKKKIDAGHITIKLKPILGIKPERYIPVIYISIAVILLFILVILPVILKNGSKVTITSTPKGASVWIDGQRIGSTPVTTFVKRGNRNIHIQKENFNTQATNEKVGFRRKKVIIFNLVSNDENKILNSAFNNLANWSLIPDSEINSRFRIPNFLSDSISDFYYSKNYSKDEAKKYLYSSIKLVTNQYILSDYLRSLFILNSDKKMTSISSLKESLLDISKIRTKSSNSELLLYSHLLDSVDFDKKRYQKLLNTSKKVLDNSIISYESSMADRKINSYNFKYIPKGNITPLESNFIHQIEEESFYISDKMITKEDYFEFVMDNVYWSKSNISSLIDKKLVDENYLEFSNNEVYITNISFFAAKNWIEWANKNWDIPDGYKLELPTESRWLSATLYGALEGIEAWHWTSQGYYIYDHFLSDENGQFIDEYSFIEPRLVVGNNKYSKMGGNPRGVQKANWCTPFLGFRPVLIKD